jgi:hypothetical protein
MRQKHAKARHRRRLQAQERLARNRRQSQHAAEALQQAIDDLGLPEDLVAELEGRLRSQQKLLAKICEMMFPPLFGCRTNTELCRVRGWDKNLSWRLLGTLPKRSWIKRLRRLGVEVLVPLWRHTASASAATRSRWQWTWGAMTTRHDVHNAGKPWHYLLIPHDALTENMTIIGLASQYRATS